MIDSHAHLNDEILYDRIDEINTESKKVGVDIIINVGYDLKSSRRAVEIAEKYENMYAIIGIHPENAKDYDEQVETELIELAKSKKVVAIGEIGIDYHYEKETAPLQKEIFAKQIRLSNMLKLPIVIHTRDAIGDTLKILSENEKYLTNGVLFHCFNASLEVLREVEKKGYFVAFGGAITFKNARGLIDCVKCCNIKNMLLETDCPYMSPEPFRGKVNTPKNIAIVCQKVAEIKDLKSDDVAKITTENTLKFFNIWW